MKNVVINRCFGGFGLSHEAIMLYAKKAGVNVQAIKEERHNILDVVHYYKDGIVDDKHYWYPRSLDRADPILVEVVQELGKKANTRYSELQIVAIPDDVDYNIEEYDGNEWVAEKHRTWP